MLFELDNDNIKKYRVEAIYDCEIWNTESEDNLPNIHYLIS